MAGLSTYLSNLIFSSYFDNADCYVGLHSANPTDAGTTGEVTTTINAGGRILASFGAPSSKVIANDDEVEFGDADGGATITHFSLWDAPTGGNCLGTGALTTSRTIVTGDPVLFPIGSLTVNLA